MTEQPTLCHCANARSLRCRWAAEEVGLDLDHDLDLDFILLPFPPRAFAPGYKAVNPPSRVRSDLATGGLRSPAMHGHNRAKDFTCP